MSAKDLVSKQMSVIKKKVKQGKSMRQRQEGVTEFKGFFQVFHYSSISEGHQSPR